jgi:hypothetical protein
MMLMRVKPAACQACAAVADRFLGPADEDDRSVFKPA